MRQGSESSPARRAILFYHPSFLNAMMTIAIIGLCISIAALCIAIAAYRRSK